METNDKTYKGWCKSKEALSIYLKHGDRVDKDLVDYFIDEYPPTTWTEDIIQMGESFSRNRHGRPTFLTLVKRGSFWLFAGDVESIEEPQDFFKLSYI